MDAKNAGMLAKVVRPATAFREANYSRDTVKIRDDSICKDNRNIMDVISIGPPESDSRKVSNGREDSNIQQGHQQQYQELTTRTLSNSSRDNRNIDSQMSTAEGRLAIAIVETSITRGANNMDAKKCSEP
jgi:hypothetical protein